MTENEVGQTNPLILNIEASTSVCSVCLSRGTIILSTHESTELNEHSSIITLLIEQCMADINLTLDDIDAVAVSEGPGSYTSLRVGFSTAKGICFALNKPLITVSTLAALANTAFNEVKDLGALYCPMLDARRMEVYTALFSCSGEVIIAPRPLIVDPNSFSMEFSIGQKIVFCGNGMEKCKTLLNNPFAYFSSVEKCDSLQIVPLAITAFLNKNFADTAYASPLYLKAPNITSSRPKAS